MIEPRDDVTGAAEARADVNKRKTSLEIVPIKLTYAPDNSDNRYAIRLLSVPAADNIQRGLARAPVLLSADVNERKTSLEIAGCGTVAMLFLAKKLCELERCRNPTARFCLSTNQANLVLTVSDHGSDILNVTTKFQTYVCYAGSLLHLGRYSQAVSVYKQALQYKKSMLKSRTKPNETAVKDLMPDTDIKYQIHRCLMKLHRNDEAMEVLQSIPGKQRTAKINFALAKLLQQRGMERSAVSAYKEVLRECPLALEAVEGLLSLTVTGAEVNSLVIEANLSNMDWVNNWIKAQAYLYNKDLPQAIAVLKQLEERTPLRGNHSLLVALGEVYYFTGDNAKACNMLLRAHNTNPMMERGMDVLAALLVSEHRLPELERILPTYDPNQEHSHEVYTAIGYLMYATNNPSRAAYLAHKACLLMPHNVEALILKGRVLYDLKKYQDAVLHFREAQQAAQYRYEPYQGLVDCYVAQHRIREAVSFASNCCKQLNNAPRALT
ncbi:Anaphase promoting complex subunit 7, partial [Homalodisca vitripennis]